MSQFIHCPKRTGMTMSTGTSASRWWTAKGIRWRHCRIPLFSKASRMTTPMSTSRSTSGGGGAGRVLPGSFLSSYGYRLLRCFTFQIKTVYHNHGQGAKPCPCYFGETGPEAVFIARVCRVGEAFRRQTRRFSAAILGGLQGKSTQYAGKKAVRAVCNAYENGF